MSMKRTFYLSVAAVSLASLLGVAPARLSAQSTLALDNDDIGGVVTGPNGPEAGVWVIVETTDFGTKLAKMVGTDEQGRYVVPDLPRQSTKSGCAAMASSTRRKSTASPARFSI